MRRAALVAGVLLCAACTGDEGADADTAPAAAGEPTFAPALGVDLAAMEQRPSGLYVLDQQVGTGAEVSEGQTVTVHYTGWLPDGEEFDSSRRGDPFEVVIGEGNVIDGWDEGIQGMKVGGKRRLVIPPQLAYGDRGAGGVIPPGATLVFDVELLGVR